jgi:hypothetical protein
MASLICDTGISTENVDSSEVILRLFNTGCNRRLIRDVALDVEDFRMLNCLVDGSKIVGSDLASGS